MSIIYFSGVGPWLLFNSQNGPGSQKGLGTSALGDIHEPTPFTIVKVLTLKSPQRCASCEVADRSFLGQGCYRAGREGKAGDDPEAFLCVPFW